MVDLNGARIQMETTGKTLDSVTGTEAAHPVNALADLLDADAG
jgi:hypothetical protein